MNEKRTNLQERWIEAMCRITCSLISVNGLKVSEALIVCREYRKRSPAIPKIKTVQSLEREASKAPQIPEYIRVAFGEPEKQISTFQITQSSPVVKKVKCKPNEKRLEPQFNIEDYPLPWCKVIKNGELIRYEDSAGYAIPEIFWPRVK